MTHFPARFYVSPALGADVAAAAVAIVAALFASGPARVAAIAAALSLAFVAFVRFGTRPPVGFVVDEAKRELVIGDRRVALADVAVGPRSADGRSFRLYELAERVRTYEVRGEVVAGAAQLHVLVERLGAKVTVAHAERRELAVTVGRVLPVTLGLCGISFAMHALDNYHGQPYPIVLFGGLSLAFALMDAVGVASPAFIVDGARRRVYWRRWHAVADVQIETPWISNLATPDLTLRLSGRRLRLGLAWMPTAPIKAALQALPGVVPRDV